MNTRLKSRKIFEDRGYIRVFSDINNGGKCPYEDWYIHPDLVDMELVNNLIKNNKKNYKLNVKAEKYFNESPVNESINWQDFEY